jgi:glycerate-2-kinase
LTVVAAGKAARGMADAFARLHGGRVRDRFVADGAHPLPDARSAASGARALAMAREAAARGDALVVLLSGGASAMLCAPADPLSLDDKIEATRVLLRSGLAIAEINAVRKHLSAIKGGRLAACAGRCVTYAISDVHAPIPDDPAVIGSGPAVADASTYGDGVAALRGAGAWEAFPAAAREHLSRGARGELPETPKPGDARLARAEFVLAGSRRDAMEGARAAALALGYDVETIDAPVLGEASAAAASFIDRVRATPRARARRPLCVVASGETTVTLPAAGGTAIGGRNQEFALAVLPTLADLGVCALASAGTDGVDGPTDAAGAIADSTSLSRAVALGLDPGAALRAHDSHPFFRALGDLVVTGPTGTNVGDLQIFLRSG